MDESFRELEEELKGMALWRPSRQLGERVGLELRDADGSAPRVRYVSATNLRSWKWSGWRTAGLAAALALVGFVGVAKFKPRPAPSSSKQTAVASTAGLGDSSASTQLSHTESYRPVSASNVLYDLKDEGTVRAEGQDPVRRLRYRYVDTYTWKSSRGNAWLKWSVPRDEIRVYPVSLN